MNADKRNHGTVTPTNLRKLRGHLLLGVACGIALVVCVNASHATLIATDHFVVENPADPSQGEYQETFLRRNNASGAGQNPNIPGFTDPWVGNVTSGTSMAVAQWTAAEGGIETTLPYATGDRARFSGVDNFHRRVQRQLAPFTPSDTYYMSFLSQVLTGDTGLDGFLGVGFTNVAATITTTDGILEGGDELRGLLIGASADGSATNYVVRHVGSTGTLQDDIIQADIEQNVPGTTTPFVRHTIVKLDFNDDPGNPNGNSKLTIWQDPTDLTSELNATASVTPLEFRTFALDTNADISHLMLTGIDYSRPASWDEPRLATTWASVTSIPEPGTLVIGSLGLGILMVRQRRKVD